MKNTNHLLIRKLFIDIYQEYLGAKTGFELSILGILLQFLALIFRLEILNPIEKILRSETNAAVIDAFANMLKKTIRMILLYKLPRKICIIAMPICQEY